MCSYTFLYSIDVISANNKVSGIICKVWNVSTCLIFNINRYESTKHFCDLLSASFKIDLLQLTLLSSQMNSPTRLIFTSVNVLKYDCIMIIFNI